MQQPLGHTEVKLEIWKWLTNRLLVIAYGQSCQGRRLSDVRKRVVAGSLHRLILKVLSVVGPATAAFGSAIRSARAGTARAGVYRWEEVLYQNELNGTSPGFKPGWIR